MATSEQLEREAEATRAQIAATLDELRSRIRPGQVVDQLVDYARDSGGADFLRNFGRQVAGNPIPVALVGAGLAWLMMARRGGPVGGGGDGFGIGFGVDDVAERMSEAGGGGAPEKGESLRHSAARAGEQASANVASLSDHAVRRSQEWGRQARATAGRLNEQVGEAGASLQDTMSSTAATMRDTMSSTGATMRDAASGAYDTAAAAYGTAAERSRQGADALSRTARTTSDNLAATGRTLWDFLQGQPLVLAGIGLALGAVLGGSLPSSEAEDQLMGEASEAVKHDAKAFAGEQADKATAVASEAWNAAKPEIDEQLHRPAEHAGAQSGGGAEPAHEPGREATLVPSDEAAQVESERDGAPRATEHPAE